MWKELSLLVNPKPVHIKRRPCHWRYWQSCNISTAPALPSVASLLHPSRDPTPSDAQSAITVRGFVRSVRLQKKIAFLALGDGSAYQPLQVILHPDQCQGLSTGIAVSITGDWKPCPSGTKQSHEMHAQKVEILGEHEAETYPIQKKFHSAEFLRKIPHLRTRTPFNALLLRLRSHVITSCANFFETNDFVQTHAPVITSSDCEGAGEVFTVTTPSLHSTKAETEVFFRQPKFLTVSAQLHLEALAASVGKVWTLSPTFRAEKSDTTRHLSEFYMLEAEMMFTDDLEQVMELVQRLLQNIATRLLDSRIGAELLDATESHTQKHAEDSISKQALQKRWTRLARGDWVRISHKDAVAHLQAAAKHTPDLFQYSPSTRLGLHAEHEKYLAETIGNDGPVFVTDYPRDIKAFYMPLSPSQASGIPKSELTVSCFDLLVPDLCELAGGSLREHRKAALIESMLDCSVTNADPKSQKHRQSAVETLSTSKLDPEPSSADRLRWYVDLRRYGSAPHGGFGLGFDRLLCYLSGVSSVRDVVPFPRSHGRCDC